MYLTGIGQWFATILSNSKDRIFFFVLLGIIVAAAIAIGVDRYIGIMKRKKEEASRQN